MRVSPTIGNWRYSCHDYATIQPNIQFDGYISEQKKNPGKPIIRTRFTKCACVNA